MITNEIDIGNKGFVSTTYAGCNCTDSYTFSIHAVDRCGRVGVSNTTTLDPPTEPLLTLSHDAVIVKIRTVAIGGKFVISTSILHSHVCPTQSRLIT